MKAYPFTPRSSQRLSPGDFWAVPLHDGRFACGCVIELLPKGMPGTRVAFLGGLLDWVGKQEPVSTDIQRAHFIAQGVIPILSITSIGGRILGCRSPAPEPWTTINGNKVQRGFTYIRPWRPEDNAHLPCLSWWSYDVIQVRANRHFIEGLPSFSDKPLR